MVYGALKVNAPLFVQSNSNGDVELTIQSTSNESYTYSLTWEEDFEEVLNLTCTASGNVNTCKVQKLNTTQDKTYHLTCKVGEAEPVECYKNVLIIYTPIDSNAIKVSFEGGSKTVEKINVETKIELSVPFEMWEINDYPGAKVREVTYRSTSKKISMKECKNFNWNNSTTTTFDCYLIANENANVTILYKNQLGNYIEIGDLEFKDPNYIPKQSSGSIYCISLYMVLSFIVWL